jgi:hypothetical protein
MNTEMMFAFTFGCLLLAILIGMALRRFLPQDHLSQETKDAVRLTTGFLATMTALILGLLISSAKSSYDTVRTEVIQMSAKVTFLDRVLEGYGPEAAEARGHLHEAIESAVQTMWPDNPNRLIRANPNIHAGDAAYAAIERLVPQGDMQRDLKSQALSLAIELGELRTLLVAQLVNSISKPMLMVLIYWIAIIFVSFSMLAPSNRIATVALLISAFSVSSAVFLVLELDRPFGGLVRISNEPLLHAIEQLVK